MKEMNWKETPKDWPEKGLKLSSSTDFRRLNGHREMEWPGVYRPWQDHMSLWNKEGKPHVFVSEPYSLSMEDVKALIADCEAEGLTFYINTDSKWNPGRTVAVFVTKKT